MLPRLLASQIKASAKKMPIIALNGPRQSGKSTLVREVFPSYSYVNLERIDLRKFAVEDPRGFLAQYSGNVIIDEVQYAPELPSYLQVLVDEQDDPGRFILTGSQNFLLLQQISQSLAGRVAIYNLLPFSVEELRDTTYQLNDPNEYIVKGFYPRIYDKQLNPSEWLRDYIQTYVERDVRQLINLPDADVFSQFLEICAGRIGQLVNFSEIGSLIGVSYQTIKRWMSILKTSFILYTLHPFHQNYNKRIVKSPKLYFYDTGLACALMNIKSSQELAIHFARGPLFENFILNELLKNQLNRGNRPSFYFWRDSSGKEVDLIIDRGATQIPIEIKASKTFHSQYFKGLDYFNELAGKEPSNAIVIYGGEESQQRTKGKVLSWQELAGLSRE